MGMATTIYVDSVPITLPHGSGGRSRVEEAINETLYAMGEAKTCTYVRNLNGERLETSMAIPGETYIADIPGFSWQETLSDIKCKKRRNSRESADSGMSQSPLPPNIDLPLGVITSIDQLNDSEIRPSIFGGCSGAALLRAHVVQRHFLDDLEWIKRKLHAGIEFNKCAEKNSKIGSRTLQSNETFTVFVVKGGRRLKKIATSDITYIIKGKASFALENTSASIAPFNCLVLQTNTRSLSMIFSTSELRDRIASALEALLGIECILQDNVL